MSKANVKRVIQKMIENGGKTGKVMSVSKAMKEVGYSPAYASNPQKFTSTKTYQELQEELLPDALIVQRHNELANSSEIEHYIFPKMSEGRSKKGKECELTNDEIRDIVESVPGCRLIYIKRNFMGAFAFFMKPDNRSREKAIDMAYKVKGSYAPEKLELVKRKYQHLSNKELMELQTKLKNYLLKK